ncbi:MAG: 30S ribosomal protein S2 [Candidatus Kapaibacterium sp.]|nr:30S ribosomal protein S2 [Ignavibacteriota bacterium]MCB9220229.1 30S ribosomal protein S2 [Ignavibacteria bacterium]
MKHYVEIEQLLKAGAHFGHLTRRWNPAMEDFIFNERNGIHIIDLRKTQVLLTLARDAAYDIALGGRNILFVGTKSQAKDLLQDAAKKAGVNYVSERWLGGMLTNFATIRKSIKRLSTIDKMSIDGTYEKITKKERLLFDREREKLRRIFGGIENMTRLPGAIFIVDTKKEHLAIKEAQNLNIPVIAIVDTNSNPHEVDFPIPANDDSRNTIELILGVITDALVEGYTVARSKSAELAAESERVSKENDDLGDEQTKVKRKLRERKKGTSDKPKKKTESSENESEAEVKQDSAK